MREVVMKAGRAVVSRHKLQRRIEPAREVPACL